MREIKFRVWDKIEKKFVDTNRFAINLNGNLILLKNNNLVTQRDYLIIDSPIDRYKLMQFTGLMDKNGNEIYEDDILKHEGGGLTNVSFFKELWVKDGFTTGFNLPFTSDQYEVIGNLPQLPELFTR